MTWGYEARLRNQCRTVVWLWFEHHLAWYEFPCILYLYCGESYDVPFFDYCGEFYDVPLIPKPGDFLDENEKPYENVIENRNKDEAKWEGLPLAVLFNWIREIIPCPVLARSAILYWIGEIILDTGLFASAPTQRAFFIYLFKTNCTFQ